ncbi:hypothetical protein DSO57_1029470 [Entomophthora muscae]|uniref:Uncharacterized protein n=1 Tax=Entomophthora muscae TaxID=34485 RepID=A0ACC2TZ53_9FUNG|nr:hypothetical protein DSO57_1029470 [Entomophthora muscae]
MVPPSTPSPPVIPVAGSQWNPHHPNSFAKLEEVIKFYLPSSPLFDPRYDWVTVETVPDSPTEHDYMLNDAKLLDNFSNFNAQDEARMGIDNSASGSPMVACDPEFLPMAQFDNSPMEVEPLIPCDPDKFDAKPKGGNYFLGGTGTTLPHPNNCGEAEVAQKVVNPRMDTFLTPRE